MVIYMQLYCFFLSVMPQNDPAPFSYISPQKNPLFNDKVWTYYRILVSKRVKSQKTGPPMNPATAPSQKFLLLLYRNTVMLKYAGDSAGVARQPSLVDAQPQSINSVIAGTEARG